MVGIPANNVLMTNKRTSVSTDFSLYLVLGYPGGTTKRIIDEISVVDDSTT